MFLIGVSHVTVDCDGARFPAALRVVNMLGTVLMETKMLEAHSYITVATLPNGLYTLQIGDRARMFVVQR